MQGVKFTLIGLIVVLAALVGYGYGCGGDDGTGGGDTSAAESTPAPADGTEADGGSDGTTSGDDGDGDGSSQASDDGSGSGPLTKSQFIKQGDAICQKVPTRYRELLQEFEKENKGKKPSTAEANLNAAVPPLPEAAEELEGLTPPEGDEQKAEAIIAALEAATKGLEEKPTSELTGPKSPFAEFQKLTREYGFQVCSQL